MTGTTTPELLPCPFCGGEAKSIQLETTTGPGCYIGCTVCDGQYGDTDDPFNTSSYAIGQWNRRTDAATIAAQAARIEVLEAEFLHAQTMYLRQFDIATQLLAELAAAQQGDRWEPVNPIGMANDEYSDAEIKLCYRRVQEGGTDDEG